MLFDELNLSSNCVSYEYMTWYPGVDRRHLGTNFHSNTDGVQDCTEDIIEQLLH
jgi:hypothetical protein